MSDLKMSYLAELISVDDGFKSDFADDRNLVKLKFGKHAINLVNNQIYGITFFCKEEIFIYVQRKLKKVEEKIL